MKLSILSALLPALFAPGMFVSHMAERGAAAGGSKIEKELLDATEIADQKRGEERQDFIARLMKAVSSLTDKAWDALSQKAQDWFNSAADAKNAKADKLPDFPDFPVAEEPAAETTTRRRGSKEEDLTPKVGNNVEVETKRGKKVKGIIVEINAEVVVVKTDDGEEEFARERVTNITVFHGTAGKDEPADPMAVGALVTLLTKRGKEITGKIVEIDEEVVVLDVDGKDEEFARSRVEKITPAGGAATGEASTSRRGKTEDAGEETKKTRSVNGGVSVGQRIREIMADDTDISEEAVGKILDKEKLDYKAASLKMNFVDNKKFLDCLKAAKRLK